VCVIYGAVTNTWIAAVRPFKDALDAGITLSLPGITVIFPLTVSPRADIVRNKSARIMEEAFSKYLSGPKGKGLHGFDLNGDGTVDYIDDYIFTANYMTSAPNVKD